jgi:sugar phosphate isomerase/epimerase
MSFEPHETFIEKLNQLEASTLPVLALNGFVPGHLKAVGPETAHPEIIAFADTAFKRAQMVGVQSIVFGSGGSRRIPEGFDPELAKRQFVDLLKQMGPLAEKYGIHIVVEPLNRAETNFINNVPEGLEIVKLVGHPNIRLLCDFYHMLREDEPADHILQAAGYVYHVHIAEKERRTAPGIEGDDFRPYLRALKEIGYAGHISIESRWDDFESQLPIALASLKEQIKEVRTE